MRRAPNDILPEELARRTVEAFIREGARIEPPTAPQGILATRAATFVTLRKLGGQLRGCIGAVEAEHANVAEEIVRHAISAATRDPRFLPVSSSELADLRYGVDVLSPAEEVRRPDDDLDPSVYGVIIETLDGRRRGLPLPRIDGIESVESQWLAVHSKAGIIPGTAVRVRRFRVTRFGHH